MLKSVKPGMFSGCRKTRWPTVIVLFLPLLLAVGCSLRPKPALDQQLFQEGLEALAVTDSPAAFSRLTAEFPDSSWTARAKTIGKIQEDLQAARGELGQLRKSLDTCRVERESLAADSRSREEVQKNLDTCSVEKARLSADIRSLEKYILKLKSLLSESGIAAPSTTAP